MFTVIYLFKRKNYECLPTGPNVTIKTGLPASMVPHWVFNMHTSFWFLLIAIFHSVDWLFYTLKQINDKQHLKFVMCELTDQQVTFQIISFSSSFTSYIKSNMALSCKTNTHMCIVDRCHGIRDKIGPVIKYYGDTCKLEWNNKAEILLA